MKIIRWIFKELHKIHGESEMQNVQRQDVINDLLAQIQTPYSIFSDRKPKPLFPSSDPVLGQHLRSVGMSQQDKHLPLHPQAIIQNQHMNQKDLLEDLVTTMEFQPKQEQILYGGNLNQSVWFKHSYQTGDGENLILNILHKKGNLPND